MHDIIHVKIEKQLNTIKDKQVERNLKDIIKSLSQLSVVTQIKWIVK